MLDSTVENIEKQLLDFITESKEVEDVHGNEMPQEGPAVARIQKEQQICMTARGQHTLNSAGANAEEQIDFRVCGGLQEHETAPAAKNVLNSLGISTCLWTFEDIAIDQWVAVAWLETHAFFIGRVTQKVSDQDIAARFLKNEADDVYIDKSLSGSKCGKSCHRVPNLSFAKIRR